MPPASRELQALRDVVTAIHLWRTRVAGHYGLTVCDTILDEPYLSSDPEHQGLILHSIYHRPNGWDHIADGQTVPNGESSMWGDYHAREVALYLWRVARNEPYHSFFGTFLDGSRVS